MSNSAKLSALDRINVLVDGNSFVEIGALVTKRNTDFNLQTKEAPSDGVITGYGVIDGNPVYVYSQDASVLNGTIGEMHARKIAAIYDLAVKVGAPVIGLVDCGGVRLEESVDALEGLGQIMYKQAMASGVIPQITAVFGNCGGGLSVSASMTDFVFAEKKNGKVFVNTPNAVEGNNSGKCDTAAADFKAENGDVAVVAEGDEAVLAAVRELVCMLPSCNEVEGQAIATADDLNRICPDFTAELDDITAGIRDIADDNKYFEIKKDFAPEMSTGFIRLNGSTIGVVANRAAIADENGKVTKKLGTSLTANGCKKAADFVKFCDAFSIPVLTITNTDGFCNCMCAEKKLAKAAAELTYALANANVAKVNLITKKAIGSAYATMNSKAIGADLVFALADAEIGAMDADLAAQIISADASAKDEVAKAYKALQLNCTAAAKRGYVDAIIEAEEVRKNLLYAFDMLYYKREDRPAKKHGAI